MGVMALLRHDKKKALQQVKQLIKTNKEMACSVLTADVGGWTPIHACALRGNKKLLKAMLQAGMSVNCLMGQPEGLPGACTLLHVAANRSDKKILHYLLHHGADVNARDSHGKTALFYATQAENKDSIRLLTECGGLMGDDSLGNDQPHRRPFADSGSPRRHHPRHHHQVQQQQQQQQALSQSYPSASHDDSSLHRRQNQHHKRKHTVTRPTSLNSVAALVAPAHLSRSLLTAPVTKNFSSSPCLNAPSASSATSGKNSSSHLGKNSSSPGKKSSHLSKNDLSSSSDRLHLSNNNNNNHDNNNDSGSDVNGHGCQGASDRGDHSQQFVFRIEPPEES